jgi:hypothetical protein
MNCVRLPAALRLNFETGAIFFRKILFRSVEITHLRFILCN